MLKIKCALKFCLEIFNFCLRSLLFKREFSKHKRAVKDIMHLMKDFPFCLIGMIESTLLNAFYYLVPAPSEAWSLKCTLESADG